MEAMRRSEPANFVAAFRMNLLIDVFRFPPDNAVQAGIRSWMNQILMRSALCR